MDKSRSKTLLNNTILLALGNMGTKLITFIMVPIYTCFLSTSQYGTVDLFTTTMTMLMPIITLSVFDAVFRFVMDASYDNDVLFSNATVISNIGCVLTLVITGAVAFFLKQPNYFFFGLMLTGNVYLSFFQNFLRGTNQLKLFAAVSILAAAVSAVASVVFLELHMNVAGVLLGNVVGIASAVLLAFLGGHLNRYFRMNQISVQGQKNLLLYSIPLVPNAFSWWFTTDAARFFILFFVGASGNGLYAVATKIPALLTIFFSVFSQAWQISAVQEYESKDRAAYYSKIFNGLVSFSIILMALILIFLKPMMHFFVANDYYTAWKNVPLLLLAALFSNLSAFVGTTYIAAKKTNLIMLTTVFGMIVNALLTLLFVPVFYVQGAGIGSSLGFFLVLFLRLVNTKKFVQIKVKWVPFSLGMLLILVQTLILWATDGWMTVAGAGAIFILILGLNFRNFKLLIMSKFKNGGKHV